MVPVWEDVHESWPSVPASRYWLGLKQLPGYNNSQWYWTDGSGGRPEKHWLGGSFLSIAAAGACRLAPSPLQALQAGRLCPSPCRLHQRPPPEHPAVHPLVGGSPLEGGGSELGCLLHSLWH
jgi:hypothetical protein